MYSVSPLTYMLVFFEQEKHSRVCIRQDQSFGLHLLCSRLRVSTLIQFFFYFEVAPVSS